MAENDPADTNTSMPFQTWGAPESPDALFFRVDDGYRIRFPGVGEFCVAQDGAWTCIPASSAMQARCDAIFQQQVRPLLLSLSGEPVFHGGAVAIGDVAVAFLAPSRRGKSTLTTAFSRRGFPFLGDDCLHLDVSGADVQVRPQAGFVRLWEDSAREFGEGRAAYASGSPKPQLHADHGLPHCDRALPLARVYLLGEGTVEAPAIELLTPSQQLIGWTANAFVLDLKNPTVLKRNLAIGARLVREVPMRCLDYPRRYDALPDVIDAVLADVAA